MTTGLFLASLCLLLPHASRADVGVAVKDTDTTSSCVMPDSRALHRFRAHCVEKEGRGESMAEMKYNALGLRDRDYSSKAAPGWKRLLVLGSSGMVGTAIPEEKGVVRVLEAMLRKKDKKVEVINGSVSGYTPMSFAAIVGDQLAAYHPQYVVAYFDLSSAMIGDLLDMPFLVPDGPSRIALRPQIHPPWTMLASFLFARIEHPPTFKKFYTFEAMGYRAYLSWKCLLQQRNIFDRTHCMLGPTLQAFRWVKEQVEASGAKFLVLYSGGTFTNSMHISPAYDLGVANRMDRLTPVLELNTKQVGDELTRLGIQNQVVSRAEGNSLNIVGDYHYNTSGAQTMAEILLPEIKSWMF